MSATGDTGTYRFSELGWAQFERVCDELLTVEGLGGLEWTGRADEIRVALADHVPTSLAGARLAGPTVVGVVWLRPGTTLSAVQLAHARAEGVFARDLFPDARSALLLTNARAENLLGGAPAYRSFLEDIAALGPAELSMLVDSHPRVRRAVPSLLGVRDLHEILDAAALERSSWDLVGAAELTRVFVPTRAYRDSLDVLERHNFAVLTGPPEMGKTAIARVLGLALAAEGWEVHECIRPEQAFAAYAPARTQLFIADDAFGSTEYRPDAAERWALELDRILRSMDEGHRLVWTSRPAPLKAGLGRIHREHGIERFPQPAEVTVDAAALDVEERATILLRHAKKGTQNARALMNVRLHGRAIVEHEHFTPERIRRFATTRLNDLSGSGGSLRASILSEIAEPTAAMARSF